MNDKKDFLSSLAEELEEEKKGVSHDDLEIFHPTDKKTDELRNYKDLDYDFKSTKSVEKTPKVEPQPQRTVIPEAKKVAPQPATAVPVRKASLKDGKEPHSFQQEKLEKIEKKPIKIDPKVMIAGIIALLVIIGAVWYFVFAPKIPMPNFVGKTINDVGAWAKQNDIPTSNIIMNTEFSTEFDKDVIISQDKAEGKKIKDTTPLAFVASKGADPDEQVEFPDLMNMTYSEIKEWIDTNKLSKTKINTQYNTIVEKDLVINYDLKTGTESGFTRGSSLTINISKGPAPAGTVAVDNFVGKTYAELEQWANSKKIVLEKTEAYSDTVEVGKIISQGVKVGESLEEGGKLPVVVSKGKAVKIPNLVGYTKEMLEVWAATPDNKVTIVKKERYDSAAEGNVIAQSITAGSQVDQGSVLELTISLYMPQLETNSRQWYGKDYLELTKWVDDANAKGASLATGSWAGTTCSDEYKTPGQIIEYTCLDSGGSILSTGGNGCSRPLPINAKISMKVSSGACTVQPTKKSFKYTGQDYDLFKALCGANGITISLIETVVTNTAEIGKYKVMDSAGNLISIDTTLTEGTSIIVKVNVAQPAVSPAT